MDANAMAFSALIRQLVEYLQPRKGNELLEAVSKMKDKGGMNLINVKKIILTIESHLIINSSDQRPETDEVIYQLGTHRLALCEEKIIGPTAETIENGTKEIVQMLILHQKEVKKFKTRKKTKTYM